MTMQRLTKYPLLIESLLKYTLCMYTRSEASFVTSEYLALCICINVQMSVFISYTDEVCVRLLIFRLHRMHEMLTILTDVRSVCLSVSCHAA